MALSPEAIAGVAAQLAAMITAFGVVAGALVAVWRKVISPLWENRKTRRGLLNLTPCYDELNQVRGGVHASRAVLLGTENGGGVPGPGTQVTSSVFAESVGALPPVKPDWQGQPVDEQYARLLHDVITKGEVILRTNTMSEGVLRTLYRGQGITHSCVRLVSTTNHRVYYLSVNWTGADDVDILTPTHRNAIRASALRLSKLLR